MPAVPETGPHQSDEPGATTRALVVTHEWFEVNSGWAPPDPETLGDWALEAACRAPDGCWVPLRGICRHGLVSWRVVLDALEPVPPDQAGPA